MKDFRRTMQLLMARSKKKSADPVSKAGNKAPSDYLMEIAAGNVWPDAVFRSSAKVYRAYLKEVPRSGGKTAGLAINKVQAYAVYSKKDKTLILAYSGKKPTPGNMTKLAQTLNLSASQVKVFMHYKVSRTPR